MDTTSLPSRPSESKEPSLPEPSEPSLPSPENTTTAPPPDDQQQVQPAQIQVQSTPVDDQVVSDQDQLPTPVVEQPEKRELPVTPVGDFAKTIDTLKKEGAFEEEEEAVKRARQIEQGEDIPSDGLSQ